MEKTFGERLIHSFNVLRNRDPTPNYSNIGAGYTYRPDRPRMSRGTERSIVNSIYNRIALDVASVDIKHCRVDDNNCYMEDIDSYLNRCFTVEANLDQTGVSFIQDIMLSMMSEGCVAVVPVDTTFDPKKGSFDVQTMRTGKILEWYPAHVKVQVYNELTGKKEDIVVPKRTTAIIENPFYAVMNEPNSMMQRLIHKLSLLDAVDEQSSAGKLDLIIQLPYVIKSQARRKQADDRRKEIEMQLSGSKYGIAYTDGTERITQLNRPIENNLLKQIEYLTNMVFSQLNMSQSILDGTADEKTMINYNNRTIATFLTAIVLEMKRKFLTKTAITQHQSIMFFSDPFKLTTIADIANAADVFTRNEIMTSNEIRQKIGMRPSDDPKADQLLNSNMPHPEQETAPEEEAVPPEEQVNDDSQGGASHLSGDMPISSLFGPEGN